MDLDFFESQKRKQRISWLKSSDFYKKIYSLSELVDRLSQKNMESINFISLKKKIICPSIGMNASLYSFNGIISLCEIGDVVDAFILLRKIRDNLYLDLFFISESMNNKADGFNFPKPFSEMKPEEVADDVARYIAASLNKEEKSESIQSINSWFSNEYSSDKMRKLRSKYFSFYGFKKNIEDKYKALEKCHETYLKDFFIELDNGLNNYVHSNGPTFISNDRLNMNKDLFINAIKDLLKYLGIIKRVFLIDLFFINSTIFQTDDYVDCLEMGVKPLDGSQYDVIYQVVEEFQNIYKENYELYNYLKDNNKYFMRCFFDDTKYQDVE